MDEAWALEAELRSRAAGANNSRTFDRVIHLEVGQQRLHGLLVRGWEGTGGDGRRGWKDG